MKIDILTLFPEMFSAVFENSIIGRAQKNGIVEINTTHIRNFANNKHNRVDDYPYGGGDGMVMAAEPIARAIEASGAELVCYLTPKGRPFDQTTAKVLSKQKHIAFLCGHYEGVDERVIEECVDLEISLGDFVLTGGEIPTMAVVDATVRLLDGVLSEEHEEDSFYNGLLEYPQYTRPEEWNSTNNEQRTMNNCGGNSQSEFHSIIKVPDVLLSGNHKEIAMWRREKAIEVTRERRADLLKGKRIGVLGGSFNPVHEGHIDIARQAQELYSLDKVIFMPCSVQPFKQGQVMVEDYHRLACLQIAVNNIGSFEVSTMEIDRGGVSWTIDTMRQLTMNNEKRKTVDDLQSKSFDFKSECSASKKANNVRPYDADESLDVIYECGRGANHPVIADGDATPPKEGNDAAPYEVNVGSSKKANAVRPYEVDESLDVTCECGRGARDGAPYDVDDGVVKCGKCGRDADHPVIADGDATPPKEGNDGVPYEVNVGSSKKAADGVRPYEAGNEYFFIVGEDCEPEKWKDYDEICKLVEFVKLPRIIEVSSTGIRDGKFDFVPKKVAKYIRKNKLNLW